MAIPPGDARLLFLTRFTRLFAYSALSVILVIYMTEQGLSDSQTGMLLTFTLIGDAAISLWLTTRADRFGRRRTLIVGSLLMAAAGLVFAFTKNPLALFIAGTIGVISPSGNEVGPYLSIEQATLSHLVADRVRTQTFAWYTLVGAIATALGSLSAGLILQSGVSSAVPIEKVRHVVLLYAAFGMLMTLLFARLTPISEVHRSDDVIRAAEGLSRICRGWRERAPFPAELDGANGTTLWNCHDARRTRPRRRQRRRPRQRAGQGRR